jgi:hypothetical protein
VTGGIQSGATLSVALEGGDNQDTIDASYTGDLDGLLRYRVLGGGNDDTLLRATVALASGSTTIGSQVDVFGNVGADRLTLVATKDPADPANLAATIDGGIGRDTCSTGGSNIPVTLVSC